MVQPLQSSDIDSVWEITVTSDFYLPWTREALRQEILIAPSLGLWQDNQLQAFVLFRELTQQIEISWLATRLQLRGQGKMTELLEALCNAYSHKEELWLEVHEDNLRAQKLYEKMNFVHAGRRPLYYGGLKAALLYTKTLQKAL